MNKKRAAWALSIGTSLAAAWPTVGHAQSSTVATPAPYAAPTIAERNVLPNPPLLATGLTTLAIGYAPALGVAIASDHKGDNQLFIPVVGPWLDIGNRGCSGVTIATPNGPFEVASQQNCGSSGIETAGLIADGTIQGLGALQIIGSLFVPQKLATVVSQSRSPSFAITPTSFGGHGAGAIASGNF